MNTTATADGIKHKMIAKGIIWSAIRAKLTPHYHERSTTLPDKTEYLHVILPGKFRNWYLKDGMEKECISDTEEYFWDQAVKWVAEMKGYHSRSKEDAMQMFYREFDLTESIYPMENFRKQLFRSGISGSTTEALEKELETKTFSTKLSDKECMRIYHIYNRKKVGVRDLGAHFGVNPKTISNILHKVSSVQS